MAEQDLPEDIFNVYSDDIYQSIGLNLCKYRKLKNLSTKQLADKLKITEENLNQIEQGKVDIDAKNLWKASMILDTPMELFVMPFGKYISILDIIDILKKLTQSRPSKSKIQNLCKNIGCYVEEVQRECPLEKPRVLMPYIQSVLQDYNNVMDDIEELMNKFRSDLNLE